MVVAEVAIVFTSIHWVDTIAAIPLVLFLPGLAVLGSLQNDRHLSFGETLIWAALISAAVSVIGGLLLNLLGGLTHRSWLIYTALVVTTATFITIDVDSAGTRRDDVEDKTSGRPDQIQRRGSSGRVNVSTRNLVTAAIGLVLLAGSFALTYDSAASTQERFSQVWLIPSPQRAIPDRLRSQVGVRNHEGQTERYDVALFVGDSKTAVKRWAPVIRDGAMWSAWVTRSSPSPIRATLTFRIGTVTHMQYVTIESG